MVLRKTSDQYLATCKVSTQSINMVKRYRLTKTLTKNLLKHKISKSVTLTSRSPSVGHDGTVKNFRPISSNMQSMNLIHQHGQEI